MNALAKVPLKVFSILFIVHWACCVTAFAKFYRSWYIVPKKFLLDSGRFCKNLKLTYSHFNKKNHLMDH